jgi:hypothetical protein
MKYYKGYKGVLPCQGCGKTGQEAQRQDKDSLCYECNKFLIAGKVALNNIKTVNAVSVRLGHAIMQVSYRLKDSPAVRNKLSYISKSTYKDINNEVIMEAVAKYLKTIALSTNDKLEVVGYLYFNDDGNGDNFFITEENAKSFVKMMLTFHEFSNKNYEAGQNHGKSLLHAMLRKETEMYS